MKKILSYILITFIIVANLFAPISVGWGIKNGLQIQPNKIEAATLKITLKSSLFAGDNTIKDRLFVTWPADKKKVGANSYVTVTLYGINGTEVKAWGTKSKNEMKNMSDSSSFFVQFTQFILNNLTPETSYVVKITATLMDTKGVIITKGNIAPFLIKTIAKESTKTGYSPVIIRSNTENADLPYCVTGFINIHVAGCIAQTLYYGLFIPSTYLFALSGTFFDNTFHYSVQSSSYQSAFVVQGWSLVRDFVDMFFIFVLLYIAFGTILNLNGVKTKEMIINVIIIGLLINFSLFAVRLIVDTSNILARVFYNSNTIKITKVEGPNPSKVVTALNQDKVIPLSAALVNKINPQNLIINAGRVGRISESSGSGDTTANGISAGTFILVTLLATGVSLVGFTVFLTVGLLFLVRVVGLWLAMIVAPIAFFSYTVPAMQKIEMVGWKKWWPELLSLAFLAPVFIFFIYLILQFLNMKLGIMDANNKSGMAFVMAIVIPFAFIMVLLMKAKKIAVKMSGDMGAAVAKAGSAISGAALGAATGGASMAMRTTIGRTAGRVADSDELKKLALKGGLKGRFAKMRLKTASSISKSSFDPRNTKAGNLAGKGLGVELGKAKEGGFKGWQERKAEKKIKEEELFKPSDKSAKQQDDAAKDWEDKYEKAMVIKKRSDEGKDEIFKEKEFREKYEKTSPKILTSDELNKERSTNKASIMEYGKDYVEARNIAKDDAKKSGNSFNEAEWRKNEQANGRFKKKNLNESDSALVSELRKQSKPEKPPISELEKYNAETAKNKATETRSLANTELSRIAKDLEKVADRNNIEVKDVNKEIITKEVESIQNTIINYNTDISVANAKLNKDPENKIAKQALLTAELGKKREENAIDKLSKLLPNKETYQKIKTDQTDKINQLNDKLLNK